MEKRCLVTGATGFVGSNLCKKLIEQDWNITIICRKSSKLDNLEEIKNKINIYVNLLCKLFIFLSILFPLIFEHKQK